MSEIVYFQDENFSLYEINSFAILRLHSNHLVCNRNCRMLFHLISNKHISADFLLKSKLCQDLFQRNDVLQELNLIQKIDVDNE